jgi:hypothetical protein
MVTKNERPVQPKRSAYAALKKASMNMMFVPIKDTGRGFGGTDATNPVQGILNLALNKANLH